MVKPVNELKKQQRKGRRRKRRAEKEEWYDFLSNWQQTDGEMTSSMVINQIHHYIKEHKISRVDHLQHKILQKIKFCKICDKWNRLSSIKSCYHCEDHYHKHCLKGPIELIKGKFICNRCQQQQIPSPTCKACRLPISDKTPTLTCHYCSNEYHPNCIQNNTSVCKRCVELRRMLGVKRSIYKKGNNKITEQHIKQTNLNLRDLFAKIKSKKENLLQNSKLRPVRKGCEFKALTMLTQNPKEIEFYRSKLIQVIKAKKMNYTQDLKNIEFQFKVINEGDMNFGLENMSFKEEEQYHKYKKQPIGPFNFSVSAKGYGVVADKDIPQYSIICEYVGEVVTLRQCSELDQQQENDSKMDLWIGRNSDEKLVIRPQKWTNIGRFLNGVKDSTSDINVRSIRLCYRGLPVILLLANRDIKKGENLEYDYNAGGIEAKFKTVHFE